LISEIRVDLGIRIKKVVAEVVEFRVKLYYFKVMHPHRRQLQQTIALGKAVSQEGKFKL
jgi:hypothetical protein